MKYKVLISESPIPDSETAERLEALGLRVPFVTSDEDFNIYAYLPEDSKVKMSAIREIHYFEDSFMKIDERELKSHEDKIEEFNSVEVGDKVKISGYRNLVTEVEEIDGDLITTRINLRGYVFRFTNKLNRLSKSDVVFENKEYQFNPQYKETLYVDLKELDYLAETHDRYNYIVGVFNLVLRLKLSYTRLNVALLKPRFGVDRLFGFTGVTGSYDVRDLIHHLPYPESSMIYTLDQTLYHPDLRIVTKVPNKNIHSLQILTQDKFKRINGVDTGDQFQIYLNLCEKYDKMHPKPIFNEDRVKSSIVSGSDRLKKDHPECFDVPSPIEYLPPDSVSFNKYSLDIEDLYRSLLDDGFIQIVENLDYYINIIKG